MAPKFPQNPSRSYRGNAPISALLQQGPGDRGLPAAPRPKSKRRRAGGAVPGGSCRSRPAAVDATGWVPARQDAPRVDCSAPLAAPLSKTTDVFRAVALAVGGVMSTYVEQGRNLLPQRICLGMARVCRRLRRQPRQHQPSAPLQPGWETVARDGAGRASTLSHPAFAPFHLRAEGIGKHGWNRSSAPCRRMGAGGPRVPEQAMPGLGTRLANVVAVQTLCSSERCHHFS